MKTSTPKPMFISMPKKQGKSVKVERLEEWQLQMYICETWKLMQAEGYSFAYAGDMNAGKRTPWEYNMAKATGMQKGEPDMRLNFPGGRTVYIELKRRNGGFVNKDQRDRHKELRDLGFEVRVARLKTMDEATKYARDIIEEYLGEVPAAAAE